MTRNALLLWKTAPLLGLALTALAAGCAPQKKTYTVPSVTKEINDGVRTAQSLKDRGKLKDASLLLQKVSKAVLEEYPQATMTQEPVKKLLDALAWIANLCLDRSLELKNEAVSSEEDSLSKKFAKWSDVHREHATKIRDLIPRLQKAEVAPARPAAPAGDARPAPGGDARPAPGGDARPAPTGGEPRPGAGEPARPSEPGQPRPAEPAPPAGGDSKEPG